MNLISKKKKKYLSLNDSIRSHIFNTSIQELDGKINIIEDNKKDFQNELAELERLSKEISLLKGVLYDKNNTFKLSDGRTIQTAIVDNNNLRKLKSSYEMLLNYRNNKKRVSEVNNSYFEVREINFNTEEIKSKLKEIDLIIQKTDFEISKLNSKEFVINI